MLPTIQIKDDFFTKKEFNILSNNLNKLKFECFVQDNGITSGFYHPFEENKNNKWLYNKVKKNFFPNQNLNTESLSASDNIDDRIMKNLQFEKMSPGMMGYNTGGIVEPMAPDFNSGF